MCPPCFLARFHIRFTRPNNTQERNSTVSFGTSAIHMAAMFNSYVDGKTKNWILNARQIHCKIPKLYPVLISH